MFCANVREPTARVLFRLHEMTQMQRKTVPTRKFVECLQVVGTWVTGMGVLSWESNF